MGQLLGNHWAQTSGPAVTLTAPDSAQATVTLLAVGTYHFTVTASDGLSTASAHVTITAEVPPPPPAAPMLSPNPSGSGSYSVAWGAVSGATRYPLQEAANGGSWSQVQNTSARSWSTSGRANGSYRYRARSCNAIGCGSWSVVATETVARIPGAPTLTGPNIVSGGSFTLSWTSEAGATDYVLQEASSADFSGAGSTDEGTATSAQESAGSGGDADLYFRVHACGAGGCGAWSNTHHVTVFGGGGGGGGFNPKIATVPKTASGSGPGPLVVDTAYSAGGYPEQLTRASDGSVYATVAAMDAWGHATLIYEGGSTAGTAALILARGYDQVTGRVTSISATNAWDGFGNLTSRSQSTSAMTGTSTEDAIGYDALNRLTGSTTTLSGGGSLTRSYRYDASGNRTAACSGSTCTVYSYGGGGAGPHALSAVNGNSSGYAYNASGEMTHDAGRSLTWSAFGKATRITRGNTTVTIDYGPGNRRTRKTVTGPLSETVTYLGSAERLDINGSLSIRRTLGLAGIAIIDTGGAQSKRLYPITDHLGSTIAIADSSGHLVQGLAYADFGQRYSAGWGAALTTAQALGVNTTLSDRGYSGQESLDAIGLDDYNARLYDPSLGRFLSVDPLIGHPGSTQGINPYSYVANNPLNKTDPTGESSCSGTSRTCVTMPMGNIKTKMVTPLGSHIPQKVSVNMSTGAVSGSLAGTDGHSIARSTDYNSMESFSPAHAMAANSTGSTNVSKHQVGKQSDARGGEPSDISNHTTENSGFASHISVHHKGNRTDVTINLTMSWNRVYTKEVADLAKASIERYWNGTVNSDGKIYSVRTQITEVGVDPLIGDIRGQLDLQPCAGCSLRPGGINGEAYVGRSTLYAIPSLLESQLAFAHEFGHNLGLNHQRNETGDIMSYAKERRLTAWDIKRLISIYGGK